MKPTYRPGKKSKHTTSGFRKRMSTKGGKKVLNARRAKGRHRIAVKTNRKGHYK
ncbi:MAG: 50S ribosomal protein L34 [Deltaproteobacteria bacterium]|nr:50S ribosomal protein L34 [Deltaproteobacteria bacterium]